MYQLRKRAEESWDGVTDYPLDPYGRWIRWPIIRDQQELAGRADAYSTTAPIWTEKGIHIVGASEAKLGTYCAAKAVRKFYATDATDAGAGPEFKAAWFKDASQVVIHLEAAATDSVTVGYGRHIQLTSLSPLTDASGIPVLTFFNRAVNTSSSAIGSTSRRHESDLVVEGTRLRITYPARSGTICDLRIFDLDGRQVHHRSTTETSVDLAGNGWRGSFLVVARIGSERWERKINLAR